MKRLSSEASAIFARLIDILKDKEFHDIQRPDEPTLNIKRFETVVHLDGTGYLFSVGLFTDKTRLRFITQVVSLVIDQRVGANKSDILHAMPFYYRDDPNGIIQNAAVFSNGTLILTDEIQQRDICSFMERWLIDLETDGYV